MSTKRATAKASVTRLTPRRLRALSLDEAVAVINGTFAAGAEHRCSPLAAIVLDAGGRVKAFLKQDGCSMLRFEVSRGKAYGALALGRSSRMVLQKAREKPWFMQSLETMVDSPMFLEGGGQLIRCPETGEVVGAIGVTGDVNDMDDICAIEGIRAAGYKTDFDFGAADEHRLKIVKSKPITDPRGR
ncbi:MAG: heme-binding protein [Rhizobiales bacterium]|nr:heme-binding protein [Hyphomicrobiales bacterium]